MKPCIRCNSRKNLTNYSTKQDKSGFFHRYWMCRKCNTARLKKYRNESGGKIIQAKANSKYRKRNPVRVRAWNAIRCAGLKKKPCADCGKRGRIHWHHPDPKKKLEVVPLCPACHVAKHRDSSKSLTFHVKH